MDFCNAFFNHLSPQLSGRFLKVKWRTFLNPPVVRSVQHIFCHYLDNNYLRCWLILILYHHIVVGYPLEAFRRPCSFNSHCFCRICNGNLILIIQCSYCWLLYTHYIKLRGKVRSYLEWSSKLHHPVLCFESLHSPPMKWKKKYIDHPLWKIS